MRLHARRRALPTLLMAALAPMQEGVSVWATGSTEKVQDVARAELRHDGVWDTERGVARLRGVRGEHVPFQVVVTADHVEVQGVSVAVSDLRSESGLLPSEARGDDEGGR